MSRADVPFTSRYVTVEGARLHYVEGGSGDAILFLHGNPTWSYIWRNIIPRVAPYGRCLALDLVGMGNSAKPDIGYRLIDHARYVEGFIAALDLRRLTLVLHDWGSALGFHYARRHEVNVRGLAFMEAILKPYPTWEDFPVAFRGIFQAFRTPEVGWKLIVERNLFIEKVLPGGIVRRLSAVEMDAYRAPFLDPGSRAPLWRWPNELPIAGEPADVVEIVSTYGAWLERTPIPKLFFAATPGALVTPAHVAWCRASLPNLTFVDLGEGLHYLQEDHAERIGAELAAWLRTLG